MEVFNETLQRRRKRGVEIIVAKPIGLDLE
jgi:hypothetical protein